jgi:hypothetical protein
LRTFPLVARELLHAAIPSRLPLGTTGSPMIRNPVWPPALH